MNAKILIEIIQNKQTDKCVMIVQNSASKADAIELLAIGTHSVMEQMGIPLMDYLEVLMEARESTPASRTIVDAFTLFRLLDED